MKTFRIFTALAAMLVAAGSCTKLPADSGTGELRIDISGELPSVRAAGDDGELMNSLRVWAVSEDGTIYRSAAIDYADGASTRQDEVVFEDMLLGDYTLYAVANCTVLDAYDQGGTIDAAFTDATLPKVNFDAGGTEPSFDGSGYGQGMPLSYSGPLHVSPGTNIVSVGLLRVCGQINIVVRNHTDRNLVLERLELSEDNPDSGYLFFKDHESPAGTDYGPFSKLPDGQSPIEPSEEATVISQYLYETAHNRQLGLYVKGLLEDPNGTDSAQPFGKDERYDLTYIDSYGNPVPLNDLCRNQRLTLAVNVYWTGDEARLGFSVSSWIPDNNETTFD